MSTGSTCPECGRTYNGNGYMGYCCRGCYEKHKARVSAFNCPVCGKNVTAGGYSMGDPRLKGLKKTLSTERFCSLTCAEQYWSTHESSFYQKLKKKEAKNEQKESIEEEKREKREEKKKEIKENAKITSDESLEKVTKACLFAGLFGVHRFLVGKFISGFCMPFFLVYAIILAINEKSPRMLLIALIDVVWWLFDLLKIKCKKFTDKQGYTIKE